jgi:hypothetical protein
MTRSHVLLHCPNAKIRTAREKAWEGEHPGSPVEPTVGKKAPQIPRTLGVGRVMEDGVDEEEEARAGRLDRWIPWETKEWVVPRAPD